MSFLLAIQACLVVACLFSSVATQGGKVAETAKVLKPCTNGEATEAIENFAYDRVHTWNDVYDTYTRFAHCDDGAISEGFSERIGWLLVHDWKHFSDLNQFVRLNQNFQAFVVSHIDDMTAFDDWQLVRRNARHHCPAGAGELCTTIDKAAAKLKKEQHP